MRSMTWAGAALILAGCVASAPPPTPPETGKTYVTAEELITLVDYAIAQHVAAYHDTTAAPGPDRDGNERTGTNL